MYLDLFVTLPCQPVLDMVPCGETACQEGISAWVVTWVEARGRAARRAVDRVERHCWPHCTRTGLGSELSVFISALPAKQNRLLMGVLMIRRYKQCRGG